MFFQKMVPGAEIPENELFLTDNVSKMKFVTFILTSACPNLSRKVQEYFSQAKNNSFLIRKNIFHKGFACN